MDSIVVISAKLAGHAGVTPVCTFIHSSLDIVISMIWGMLGVPGMLGSNDRAALLAPLLSRISVGLEIIPRIPSKAP